MRPAEHILPAKYKVGQRLCNSPIHITIIRVYTGKDGRTHWYHFRYDFSNWAPGPRSEVEMTAWFDR